MRIVIEWPEGSDLPTQVYLENKKPWLSRANIETMVDMYLAGKPMKEIEKFSNRSERSVREIIAKHVPPEQRRNYTSFGLVCRLRKKKQVVLKRKPNKVLNFNRPA